MTLQMPVEASSTSESHSSPEDLSALVEQKIVDKGHIQWDCVPWVLSAIDQLEQHRKYYVDVAHRLLEHLSNEPTLIELSEQQHRPDKGKGKQQSEGSTPASGDPRSKLKKAAWDKVREVAASELNDARLYWALLPFMREMHILHVLLEYEDEPQDIMEALSLQDSYFDLTIAPWTHMPAEERDKVTRTAERVKQSVANAATLEKAVKKASSSKQKKAQQLRKAFDDMQTRFHARKNKETDDKLRRMSKLYVKNARLNVRHVQYMQDAVNEYVAWERAHCDSGESQGQATQNSNSQSQKTESTLAYTNASPPEAEPRHPSPSQQQQQATQPFPPDVSAFAYLPNLNQPAPVSAHSEPSEVADDQSASRRYQTRKPPRPLSPRIGTLHIRHVPKPDPASSDSQSSSSSSGDSSSSSSSSSASDHSDSEGDQGDGGGGSPPPEPQPPPSVLKRRRIQDSEDEQEDEDHQGPQSQASASRQPRKSRRIESSDESSERNTQVQSLSQPETRPPMIVSQGQQTEDPPAPPRRRTVAIQTSIPTAQPIPRAILVAQSSVLQPDMSASAKTLSSWHASNAFSRTDFLACLQRFQLRNPMPHFVTEAAQSGQTQSAFGRYKQRSPPESAQKRPLSLDQQSSDTSPTTSTAAVQQSDRRESTCSSASKDQPSEDVDMNGLVSDTNEARRTKTKVPKRRGKS